MGRYGVTRPWSEREIELCCRTCTHAQREKVRERESERESVCVRGRGSEKERKGREGGNKRERERGRGREGEGARERGREGERERERESCLKRNPQDRTHRIHTQHYHHATRNPSESLRDIGV